jgi:hypothetical protein
MCRIRFLILVMAVTIAAGSDCQAAGSFQTKPAFPKVVTAGVAPSLPTIKLPNVSARDLVGGCGRVASAIPRHMVAVVQPTSGKWTGGLRRPGARYPANAGIARVIAAVARQVGRSYQRRYQHPILTWNAENRKMAYQPVAHRSPAKRKGYSQTLTERTSTAF